MSIEEKYDEVRQLIQVGKEKGYLLYDEVNEALPSEITSAEELQTAIYEIGKVEAFGFESLRDWFRALYEVLLGQSQGPRMGSFIALYGVDETCKLIASTLAQNKPPGVS